MAADDDRSDVALRRALAVIGHALRTPTVTVRGLADVARTMDPPDPELLSALAREARSLERLVDDLLVALAIDTALPVQRPWPVDVDGVAREVWASVDGEPEGLVVHGSVRASVGPDALRWILRHVLENASLYGGRPVEVHLSDTGGSVAVEVRSPASDVDASELEHAFELFFRGETAVMRAPGVGLGLPVARRLAEHAGGSLDLALADGQVVASLRLPAR